MKKIITFLLYCLSATALIGQVAQESRITVLSTTKTETVLQFDLTDVSRTAVQTPNGPAVVVTMPNGTQILQTGAPDVPKMAVSLLIPETGNTAFEITETEYTDYPNVAVAPSKGDLKRTVDPRTVPYKYGAVYQQNAFYPGDLVALQQPFVLRDVRGQSAWIQPVQYNAATKTLRVYTTLTVRIYNTGGTGENELQTGESQFNSLAFSQLYQHTFLNYDPQTAQRGAGEPDKMLVIVQDELLDELQPLVRWKRQMGIHTTVVRMSEIGSAEADAVYAFVQNYYADNQITYLLLVGDETMIKPLTRNDGAAYSCDNCFGYMDGTDHFPEIFVGRFHAATPAQLRIMVNRNVEYEKTPLVDANQNWCATGMASTSDQGQGIGDDNQADYEQGNEWKAKHLADGYEKYWEFYDGDQSAISPTSGDETADKAGNPVNTDLLALINGRGVGIYNYTGHGWEQGLVSGNFNTDAVAAMRNKNRYPICVAVACCAGNFTNNGAGDCLGEAYQRAGDPLTGEAWGGIAGYFSSDFQSWAPPMEGQDGINEYLVNSDGVTLTPTIGSMLAYGNTKMIAAYAGGGELMADFWNVFGEPSTVPRTRLPIPITATHVDNLFFGATSVAVNCPVEGALVSLFWQEQTLATAHVSGGVAVLNFPPLNDAGTLLVTVSNFNYIPAQSVINLTPASGPYVITQYVTLRDDFNMNANQLADYGENISFDVALHNVGVADATSITAVLSTNDPNVVILSNTSNYPTIYSGLILAKSGAFDFLVNNNVPDGHVVNFKITITFNGTYTTESIIPVKLHAPRLTVKTLTLDDAIFGNNNHRFDTGETVRITINNANLGHSPSQNGLGVLTSDSPWLTINGPIGIGPINPVTGTADVVFNATVTGNAPPATPANFTYTVTAGSYSATKLFGPYIINALFEDFESNSFVHYPWQMTGSKPWAISTASPYEGTYCSRSGAITHSQQSNMNISLNVTADGSVSFARKIKSEADYDFLRFLIDDVEIAKWSGDLPWEEFTYPVTEGAHTLTWSYEKDNIGSYSSDRAWVDGISLPPFAIVVDAPVPADVTALKVKLYPNPTSSQTQLTYELMASQQVSIGLFDCTGRPVRTLQNNQLIPAGPNAELLNLKDVPAGVYFVRIQAESGTVVERIVKQ